MSKESIARDKIEKVVNEFIETAAGEFTAQDIIPHLSEPPQSNEDIELVKSIIDTMIDVNETVFNWRGRYMRMDLFFQGHEICITPDSYELEHGILFPGHRFAIFCEPEIFISEITLNDTVASRRFRRVQHKAKLEKIVPYYTLFGLEQINDYLFADSDDNYKTLRGQEKGNDGITVTVFDLKKFYREHDFELGDALKITITDWGKGIFDLTHLPGNQRKQSQVKQWEKKFGDALEQVINEFGNYIGVTMQLSYAYFAGGIELLTSASLSLDEFYHQNKRFEMRIEGGETFLDIKSDEDFDEDVVIPECIAISQGKTASIDDILADIAIPLRLDEIDAYMLDQHYRRELEFVDFFSRCFGTGTLNFVDDAQETAFLNLIEDRWEKISSNYNRHEDTAKAPLRERILELTDERIELLRSAGESKPDAKKIKHELEELAKISARLGALLKMLNSEAYSITESDAEATMEHIESEAGLQQSLLEAISRQLDL
jgi:hypothetical protein